MFVYGDLELRDIVDGLLGIDIFAVRKIVLANDCHRPINVSDMKPARLDFVKQRQDDISG